MQISSVLDNPSVSTPTLPQTNDTAASFAGILLAAGGSAGSSNSLGSTDPVDDAVKEFMDYAKETPEQRMFSNWLGGQGITEKDYNAMSPAQQQSLRNKFEEQLESKLKNNAQASFNVAVASALTAPASTETPPTSPVI
jgi:hypothetical protein